MIDATLIAATIAAVASILTLLLRVRTERSAEVRAAYRQALAPVFEELGDALHMIVACSVMSVRDERASNEPYWRDKKAEARAQLRKLRMKVRYPLWGADEAVRALIALPDRMQGQDDGDFREVIDAATALRLTLDNTIRRCYAAGRPPSGFERWSIARRVRVVRQAWDGLDEAITEEEFTGTAPTAYEKIFATIIERREEEFVAEDEDGERFVVRINNRSGKGSRKLAQPGTRVKLYMREHEDFYRYRFEGA